MDAALRHLRRRGYVVLEPLEATRTNDYLLRCPVYADAHVPQSARNEGRSVVPRALAAGSECLCVHTDDAVLAPGLLCHALRYTDLVAAYLERDPPVMYSMNVFWTRPGSAPTRDDIQAFHVDRDDRRFVAMFVYLTDVLSVEDGPHELTSPVGDVNVIFGPAGTAFLADTSRPHRGLKPTRGERGLAWARWGVSTRPPANVWDMIEPVPAARLVSVYPADPRLRESIRLLAA